MSIPEQLRYVQWAQNCIHWGQKVLFSTIPIQEFSSMSNVLVHERHKLALLIGRRDLDLGKEILISMIA